MEAGIRIYNYQQPLLYNSSKSLHNSHILMLDKYFSYIHSYNALPHMNEEDLNDLRINDLYKLLAKQINELIAMERCKDDKIYINEKQREIDLIQRVLIAKRTAFSQR